MSRPQFARQASRPPTPRAYEAAARILRDAATQLEACAADGATASPSDRAKLDRLLRSLMHSVRSLRKRRALPPIEGTHDLRRS